MFSDINSETLGYVWKLAHNIPTENIDKSNLPKICKELDSWVTSESVLATRRLSLRASSNLIVGAAKLYKQSLDKLFGDVKKMNEELIYRRKRDRLDSSSSESSDSMAKPMDDIPEEMRRPATINFADSSFSPTKRHRTDPIVKMTQRITMSRSPSKNLLDNVTNSNEVANNDNCPDDDNLDTEAKETTTKSSSDVNTETDVEEPFSEENPESQRRDESLQRSPILTSRHRDNRGKNRKNKGSNNNSRLEHGFDRNLPFGYIVIHETYDSRIPSKIIFTSLNSNVNNLD